MRRFFFQQSHFKLIAAVAVLACSIPMAAFGDAPTKSQRARSESDPLLDDLKQLPLAKKAVEPKPDGTLRQRLEQELTGGEDIGEENQNPLLRIGRRMQLVEELLKARVISADTQKLQKIIETELAELAAQSQNQGQRGTGQRKPAGGKQGKAGNPMGEGTGEARATQPLDSTQRLESGQASAMTEQEARALMRRLWGSLPEKTREQMLNAPIEQFLPKHEQLIRQYYKRLAEEPAAR